MKTGLTSTRETRKKVAGFRFTARPTVWRLSAALADWLPADRENRDRE